MVKAISIRERAMNYLARREHSYHELEKKLMQHQYVEHEVIAALDRLQDQGLLSDQRFAESYARYRAVRGFGPLRIRQELQQKGVKHDIIANVFANADWDWNVQLYQAWQKKFNGKKPASVAEHGKQYRFLLMRGYSPEYIHDLLS